jgi:hypothetical protein
MWNGWRTQKNMTSLISRVNQMVLKYKKQSSPFTRHGGAWG